MKEEFLHFIWKYSLFNTPQLITTNGVSCEVIYPGIHNSNAGPDFLEAKVRIGEQLWCGHVEIHVKSSDWFLHRHQNDRAYDNVILHAVLEPDVEVKHQEKGDLPMLDLSQFLKPEYLNKYRELAESLKKIPCSSMIRKIRPVTIEHWLGRLAIHRLERKSREVKARVDALGGDWNTCLYRMLAENFGFKINRTAFAHLAESLPIKVLAQHADSRFQMEALLYGQAGMLDVPLEESYPQELQREFQFLQRKFGLHPIRKSLWKKLRLRPANFPEMRISQFAGLLFLLRASLSNFLLDFTAEEILNQLDISASDYWKSHVAFDKSCISRSTKLGKFSMENLSINTIAPFLFALGEHRNQPLKCEKALTILECCGAEPNRITREWEKLGWDFVNSQQSQAGIELRNEYCANKKCLNCMIGVELLKTETI